MPPHREHPYVFLKHNPINYIDPTGLFYIPIVSELCALYTYKKYEDEVGRKAGCYDKEAHCAMACIIENECGFMACMGAAKGGEYVDIPPFGKGYSEADVEAGKMGCLTSLDPCIDSKEDCFDECKEMRKNGTLPPNEIGN